LLGGSVARPLRFELLAALCIEQRLHAEAFDGPSTRHLIATGRSRPRCLHLQGKLAAFGYALAVCLRQ
jgi:hypothetical protein